MSTEIQRAHPREGAPERVIDYEFMEKEERAGPVLWGADSYENPNAYIAGHFDRLSKVFSDPNITESLMEITDEALDFYRGEYANNDPGSMTESWYRAAGHHAVFVMADALSRVSTESGTIMSKQSVVMALVIVKTDSGNTVIEELTSLDVVTDGKGELTYKLGLDKVNKGFSKEPTEIFKSLMNQTIEALPEEE